MHNLILIIFLLAWSVHTHAQQMVFKMSLLGHTFGEMVMTKTEKNDSVAVYTLHSKGESNIFWINRKGESSLNVEYRNGELHASEYNYFNHGQLEKWTRTEFDGENYIVTTSDGRTEFPLPPQYSLIKLYFEPRLVGDSIFCEEDGSYAALSHNSEKGIYHVNCQDGSRSTYYIKEGRVEMMEIHLGMAKVKLTRVD